MGNTLSQNNCNPFNTVACFLKEKNEKDSNNIICDNSLSRILDDVPHYDPNTEINISRHTCHKMCHKKDPEMWEKMYMVLVFVLDGLF